MMSFMIIYEDIFDKSFYKLNFWDILILLSDSHVRNLMTKSNYIKL